MKSVLISSNGHVKFGRIPMLDESKLRPNQVLIKVEAAVLNPSDILFMRGKYNVKLTYPYTPGWEGSGVVVAVGKNLKETDLVGTKVGFMKQGELPTEYKIGGAMADYCVTSFNSIIPIPDDPNISLDQAATFFVNPLTAYCMVERVKELKSKACVVTAAASQIGKMIIQLLIKNGIKPICTVRRAEQVELLHHQFGDQISVINTSLPTFIADMTKVCNQLKPNSCLECISGDFTGLMFDFLGFKGHVILYGLLSDKPVSNIQAIPFLGKAQVLESFILMPYLAGKSKKFFAEMIKNVQQMYKSELKTEINARFGLHEVEKAIQFYMRNQTSGKVVLKPSLTPEDAAETVPVRLDKHFAKL